jgi:hypothetical protein
MTRLILASTAILAAAPVFAQVPPAPYPSSRPGFIVQRQPNTTGNSGDLVISRGATGADTITTSSAAGGNASFPERAIPNGSANGGGGGSNR